MSQKDHHPHPKRYALERWHRAGSSASLRNFVFGSADGLVTVLAFVAGVSASLRDRHAVLLAGIAEMFAGALSMGLGAFMGTRAERDLYDRERAREAKEVRDVPHLEREELREIYRQKGFEGDQLEKVVATLTADPERWVDIMMSEELGLQPMRDSAVKAGFVVGLSYIVAAAVPLISYVFFDWPLALLGSVVLTSAALAMVGIAKSRFTQRPLWRGALETLLMGLAGTAVCYGIGKLGAQVIH